MEGGGTHTTCAARLPSLLVSCLSSHVRRSQRPDWRRSDHSDGETCTRRRRAAPPPATRTGPSEHRDDHQRQEGTTIGPCRRRTNEPSERRSDRPATSSLHVCPASGLLRPDPDGSSRQAAPRLRGVWSGCMRTQHSRERIGRMITSPRHSRRPWCACSLGLCRCARGPDFVPWSPPAFLLPSPVILRSLHSGKVQRVFFRVHTAEEATRLNLVGFVENTPANTVVGEAVGQPADIEALSDDATQITSS